MARGLTGAAEDPIAQCEDPGREPWPAPAVAGRGGLGLGHFLPFFFFLNENIMILCDEQLQPRLRPISSTCSTAPPTHPFNHKAAGREE